MPVAGNVSAACRKGRPARALAEMLAWWDDLDHGGPLFEGGQGDRADAVLEDPQPVMTQSPCGCDPVALARR